MLKSGARFCSESVSLDEKAGLGGTRTNVGSWGSSSRGIRARKLTPAKAMAVMEPQDMRLGSSGSMGSDREQLHSLHSFEDSLALQTVLKSLTTDP